MEEDKVEEEDEGCWEAATLPLDTCRWPVLQDRTGLVYDEKMMSHCNLWDKYVIRGLG